MIDVLRISLSFFGFAKRQSRYHAMSLLPYCLNCTEIAICCLEPETWGMNFLVVGIEHSPVRSSCSVEAEPFIFRDDVLRRSIRIIGGFVSVIVIWTGGG